MAITIVGLGPGDPGLLTREAWTILASAKELYLRTRNHPVIKGLPEGISIYSFDYLYEKADDFNFVYESIVNEVILLGKRTEGVIYAVPGHPMVGEATVTALLARAQDEKLPVRVIAGLGFIEPVLAAIHVDGLDGLQIVDALDVAARLTPILDPDRPVLLGQLYSRDIASDVKLTLMHQYPDNHTVILVHAAGTEEEVVEEISLYALDHSTQISHLTSLFIPCLPHTSGLSSFVETIARLRGPGGCPWDQRQSHESLRSGLIEEVSEVLDAIDSGNMDSLKEELGDLLLHIIMHAQLATEEGEFTVADVIGGVEAKIRRRHPHVFGDVNAPSVDEVLENWDEIKRKEKGTNLPQSILDGIPISLSGLMQADAISRRAVKAGFDWPSIDRVVAKVNEEMEELLEASTRESQIEELGDVLFTLVNWARWLDIDPEMSLRSANHRFQRRFRAMEREFIARGKRILDFQPEEIQSIWRAKKRSE